MSVPAGFTQLKPDDVCALLFPGTGSAGVPDLPALAASDAGAARIVGDVLDAVQEGLPEPDWPSLRTILLEEPGRFRDATRSPGVAQLAAYTSSVAVDRVLRSRGLAPGFAVGQSFGEIAAMVCAGVFTIGDGARMAAGLVSVLTRHGAGGGMGLLEACEDDTRSCIDRAGTGEVVVACLNAPSVTVVSGPDEDLTRVLKTAQESGIRAVRLAVPYLSHHPAMVGADEVWYSMIRPYRQRPLEVPVYSPVRGRAYRDEDDLHRALADCIVKPVRLPDILRVVQEAGATVFVEGGAGNALCQCARLTLPGAVTLAPLRDRPRPAARPEPPPVGKSSPGVLPTRQDPPPRS